MTDGGAGVRSVTWVARRVDAAGLDESRRLVAALGLTVLVDEPAKLVTQTSDGDVLEYGTADVEVPDYLFDGQETVVGFLVDDLDATLAALATAGFDALSEPAAGGGVRFQHVSGPGHRALALIQRLGD